VTQAWAEPPRDAAVAVALTRAVARLDRLADHGGWVWAYAADGSARWGERPALPGQIWVQAPGTPAVGQLLVDIYHVTGDPACLASARRAALALVAGQLDSGGWDYLVDFDPVRRAHWAYRGQPPPRPPPAGVEPPVAAPNRSVYDDDTTQGVLRFLGAFLEAAAAAPAAVDSRIAEAWRSGLEHLLQAQYPNGAWPQRWDGPEAANPPAVAGDPAALAAAVRRGEYTGPSQAVLSATWPRRRPGTPHYPLYTLNDGVQRDIVRTLLAAWRQTGEARYRAAARRGIDFLLAARLPEPQPVWAQQYGFDMAPAWARSFEPPALASAESVGALRALFEWYVVFGEEDVLAPFEPAFAWFDRSTLGSGRWARFYELGSNRPLYVDPVEGLAHAQKAGRRRTYAWDGEFGVASLRLDYRVLRGAGRDAWREDAAAHRRPSPAARAAWREALGPTVAALLERPEAPPREARGRRALLRTAELIADARRLCAYLELGGRAPLAHCAVPPE